MLRQLMFVPVALTIALLNNGITSKAMAADLANEDFAVVESNGGLVRSSANVVSSLRLSTGTYDVRFNKSIAACVYQATLGLTGTSKNPPPGEISVATSAVSNTRVRVKTYDSGGSSTDKAFHLSIGCN